MMNRIQHNGEVRRRARYESLGQGADANVITAFEHQRLTVRDFSYESDFHWLMAQEFSVFTLKRTHGQWQLKVGHYIGIVVLPSGMVLELLPKLNQSTHAHDVMQTRHWVQDMLSDLTHPHTPQRKLPHTKNFGHISRQSAPLTMTALPLSDWLVAQFVQGLRHYRPAKHYQAQTDNQPSLQGRLLIKEQLRCNHMQPHKFVCETSVLSQDMLANRLIKSALVCLAPLIERPTLTQLLAAWRLLPVLTHHERQQLEAVYRQSKQQLTVLPLHQSQLTVAQRLADWAYWLLRQSDTATGHGVAPYVPNAQPRLSLLIDMNQAFEQWASLRIGSMFEQLHAGYRTLYQTQSVWLHDAKGQAHVSIRPDLLIQSSTRQPETKGENQSDRTNITGRAHTYYSHVIDIKWKALTHAAAISASDAYQLTSYAQAYQAKQVWLVYPVIGTQHQPVVLKQRINDGTDGLERTHLWLVPFDVLTGEITEDMLPRPSSEQ